jgi:hypothetical protein
MPKPVCFMVMPYGRKKTDAAPGQGPGEIDFDALWDRALRPAIVALGYDPVRADQDVGALIVHEMIERLYFSDLVLADMTIPNGNVYYEVGIRHACQPRGCVLVAADWSRPLFDVAQMRTVRYPLPEGAVSEETAAAIRAAIARGIGPLAEGTSPMFELLPGYFGAVDPSRASAIRSHFDALRALQGKTSAIRLAPRAERVPRALALVAENTQGPMSASVAHTLLRLLEDCGAWDAILELVPRLPAEVRAAPDVIELETLARSKTGDHLTAIGALQTLIASAGPTAEREGLLGGRFKELYDEAADPADRARYLSEAIAHYERGMMLDLNDFYPSSNLPRLYRERGESGDAERAVAVAQVVVHACRRTLAREPEHPWVRPTLLGAAFDAGDPTAATALCEEIIRTRQLSPWHLESTLPDLERSLKYVPDPERQGALRAIYDRLKQLV